MSEAIPIIGLHAFKTWTRKSFIAVLQEILLEGIPSHKCHIIVGPITTTLETWLFGF
jgi:hypothetical protein